MGYAEIADLELEATHPAKSCVSEIRKAGSRGTDLIQQLLAVARKRPVQKCKIDTRLLIQDMEPEIKQCIGPGVDFDICFNGNPGNLLGDSGAVNQILLNVCANARDAMNGDGALRINIARTHVPADTPLDIQGDQEYVRIDVIDNGCGMDEQVKSHVFEPFFTTKGDKGSGLGLAIVQTLVRQLDGCVTVDTKKDQGSTFYVYLPASDGPTAQATSRIREPILFPDANPAPGAVLLVEDEVQVREFVERALSSMGYRVLTADNGEKGLKLLETHVSELDLVVSDVMMPHMDGPGMIRAAKEHGWILPVLFVTGYGAEHIGELAEDPQIHMIRKPFNTRDLQIAIGALFAQQGD